jgi:ketosteroid isomerase-like protein
MSSENLAIVRRLYDAVASRDTATVLEIYHDEVEWDHSHNQAVVGLMGGQTVYRGHEGLRAWSRDWYEAWDSVDAELEELFDAGDQVVAVLNYRGRGRVSGLEVEFTQMAGIFTLEAGRVVRAAWFRTRDEALAQAGISA